MRVAGKWLAVVALLGSAAVQACPAAQEFDESGAALKVLRATLSYEKEEAGGMVTTLAAVRNTAAVCVENLVVEVNYFDADKKLVDTVTQLLYGVVLPPSQEVSFRVRDTAARDKGAYAAVQVRIVAAEQRAGRARRSEDSAWKWLESWGPMLLLIGVWIVVLVRSRGRNSPYGKTIALLEAQTAAQARQIAALERLGDAVERASAVRAS